MKNQKIVLCTLNKIEERVNFFLEAPFNYTVRKVQKLDSENIIVILEREK